MAFLRSGQVVQIGNVPAWTYTHSCGLYGVAFTATGDLACTYGDGKKEGALLLSQTGTKLSDTAGQGVSMENAKGVAYHPGRASLFVCDADGGAVVEVDATSLREVARFTTWTEGMDYPYYIAVLPDDKLAVTRCDDGPVCIYDICGTNLRTVTPAYQGKQLSTKQAQSQGQNQGQNQAQNQAQSQGQNQGQNQGQSQGQNQGQYICCDDSGNIYVSDEGSGGGTIIKLNMAGQYLAVWKLDKIPLGVTFHEGYLLVCEYSVQCISVYNTDTGQNLGRLLELSYTPCSLSCSGGKLAVVEEHSGNVHVYSLDPDAQTQCESKDESEVKPWRPSHYCTVM